MTVYGPPAPTALDRLKAAWASFQAFVNTTLPHYTAAVTAARRQLQGTSQPPTGGGGMKLQ